MSADRLAPVHAWEAHTRAAAITAACEALRDPTDDAVAHYRTAIADADAAVTLRREAEALTALFHH